MSIQEKTIKRLFAVSGNQCAFQDCSIELVDSPSEIVTAEMCHIKAKNVGGPRYDPTQTEEERNGYENLIVLCPMHHKIIDSQENLNIYTVKYLQEIKKNHEKQYIQRHEPTDKISKTFLSHFTEPPSNKIVENIFIHFFNDQMLDNYKLREKYTVTQLASIFEEVIQIAYLLTDKKLIIPTIDTAQSEVFNLILLQNLKDLIKTNVFSFAGSEISPEKWKLHKIKHYRKVRIYPQYFEESLSDQLNITSPYWIKRVVSTTSDIAQRWESSTIGMVQKKDGNRASKFLLSAFQLIKDEVKINKFIDELYKIPESLDGQAFIWKVIQSEKLTSFSQNPALTYPIELALGFMWISSHLDEYNASIIWDFPNLGPLDCGISDEYPHLAFNYTAIKRILSLYGLFDLIKLLDTEDLIVMKDIESFRFFKHEFLIPKYNAMIFRSGDVLYLNKIEKQLLKESNYARKKLKIENINSSQAFITIINIIDDFINILVKKNDT